MDIKELIIRTSFGEVIFHIDEYESESEFVSDFLNEMGRSVDLYDYTCAGCDIAPKKQAEIDKAEGL
jgi:hypothetical protein